MSRSRGFKGGGSEDSAGQAAPRPVRTRARQMVARTPGSGLTAAVRKPVKGVGRNAAVHYDPVTGRKIPKRKDDG